MMSTSKYKPLPLLIVAVLLLVLIAVGIMTLTGGQESEESEGLAKKEVISESAVVIEGRVVDGESRAAIPSAGVVLEGGGETHETKADDTGAFRFEVPATSGQWTLLAKAEGYRANRVSKPLQAKAGQRLTGVEVLAFRMSRIKGRVVHGGQPVSGASLDLIRADRGGEIESLKAKTDAKGAFEIEVWPGRVRVLVEAEGFALGESRELLARGGAVIEGVEIDLTERGSLKVQVNLEGGKPVAGAFVVPVGVKGWRSEPLKTNRQGLALLEGLPVGDVSVRVWAPKFTEVRSEPTIIEAGGETELQLILLPLQGIMGHVESIEGGSVRGARVVMRPEGLKGNLDSRQTGRGGIFRFGKLEAGRYELWATHPRYGPSETVVVEAGAEPIELVLPIGGTIEGRVRTPEGALAQRFTVMVDRFVPAQSIEGLEGQPLGPRHFSAVQVTDASGRFAIERLAPGRYDLLVDAPGYGQGRAEGIELVAGRTTRGVLIDLSAGTVLSGRVIDDETRAALSGVRVRVWDNARRSHGFDPIDAFTDDKGEFIIEGLAKGRRSLRATLKGYATREVSGIEVRGESQVVQEVRMAALAEGERPKTEFFGIGATLKVTPEGGILVMKLLDGAPGSRFGLESGDEIVRIDDQEVKSLGLSRSVELIRGEEGAHVILEVRRKGEPYPFEVEIERGRVSYETPH